jgi:hypothetical protein
MICLKRYCLLTHTIKDKEEKKEKEKGDSSDGGKF